VKDPDEVQPPGGDRFLVVFCMEKSRNRVPFTLLDYLPLDIRDSPNIRPKASSMGAQSVLAGITHVVSFLIASHTELLRSFNLFPFSPRSRVVQTSAQASPSST